MTDFVLQAFDTVIINISCSLS